MARLGPPYRAVAVQSRWSASPDLTLCPLEIKVKTWLAGLDSTLFILATQLSSDTVAELWKVIGRTRLLSITLDDDGVER